MAQNKKVLEKQLLHLLTDILVEEIENPNLSTVNITEVEMTNDLSIAYVYVDFYKDAEALLGELKGAASFIRQQLSKSLDMRRTPYLEFRQDNRLDKLNEIEKLIEETK